MTRWLTLVALAAALGACPEPTETPDPKPAATDADKTETVIKDTKVETPSVAAPVVNVPPKAKVDRDCADSDPVDVDPNAIQPMELPEGAHEAMLDPSKAVDQAPDKFKVKFETTNGDFVVEAYRPWAPNGVDRFYNMVKIGWFNDVKFFRAVDGFMTQFGITPYPQANAAWMKAQIKDDVVKQGNVRGVLTFAQCGRPNCRSNQLFINTKDNTFLDGQRFAGIGVVVEGMDVVDSLYTCYGDSANPRRPNPANKGPNQGLVQSLGNAYLNASFPKLDGIKSATIVE